MSRQQALCHSVPDYLAATRPDHPVFFFNPEALAATARAFASGFPGAVSFALKACPRREVIETLLGAGITAFDVASPAEIARVRAVDAGATLHYNNPVRSPDEIAAAVAAGVTSYAVDGMRELEKLAAQVPAGAEISVRLHLPVEGAAYDFGEKFGEGPEGAVALLSRASALGYRVSMTFHPGTQCTAPSAWARYIAASADVARAAGVRLERLNVGGGFPADRGAAPDLSAIFKAIGEATTCAFGADVPALLCEPGRALVTEAYQLAARVKALRACGAVFLNDGLYGAFGEGMTKLGVPARHHVISPSGGRRTGAPAPREVYGPTCDSLDKFPGFLDLPGDLEEGDYVIFDGMGAYSFATATAFNGYGAHEVVTLAPEGGAIPQM